MVYGSLRNREMKSNAGKICQSLIWNELIFHSLIGGTTKWITKKIKSAAVRLVLFFYAFYMLKYRFLLFPWYICLGDIGNIKRIYKWMQSWCVGTERVRAALLSLKNRSLLSCGQWIIIRLSNQAKLITACWEQKQLCFLKIFTGYNRHKKGRAFRC